MTVWLLSVAGTGILGVLIGHLTSKTRMHSVIKTACTYVFLLVLIFPIPTLITNGIDMSSCSIFGGDFSYNEDVFDKTSEAYFSIVKTEIERQAQERGYEIECEINGTLDEEKITVHEVIVILKGEFADSSAAILDVKAMIADYLEVEQSIVRVQVEQVKG